jgi:hypothetical protein
MFLEASCEVSHVGIARIVWFYMILGTSSERSDVGIKGHILICFEVWVLK